MTIQTEIARFASAFTERDLTPDLIRASRRCVIDTIAAMIVGPSSELADAVLGFVHQNPVHGDVPILGTGVNTSPERAALANGTFGHALDFDDTVSMMPGHPGSVMVAALLSASGGSGVSGARFLTAMVVGYEVAAKLGRAIGIGHYNRGWHSTGSIGVFGAVAAVANFLRLDEASTVNALGIASSTAGGLRANFGTMTKPLHSGWAASSGLAAAQLAASGFTASPGAMEAFFAAYGTSESDPDKMALGDRFTLLEPGIAHKRYPCCYAMHRAITALEALRLEGVIGGAIGVRSLTAVVPPGSLEPLAYHNPTTGFEGKFSMEYALAIGLVDGQFTLEAFTDEGVNRPEVRDALRVISAREDAEVSPGDPEGKTLSAGSRGFVRVIAELEDGTSFSRDVATPPGSPAAPLTDEEIVVKLRNCAVFAGYDADQIDRLLESVNRFEALPDISPLVQLLARTPRRSALVDAGPGGGPR